jgi:hypothetical protein
VRQLNNGALVRQADSGSVVTPVLTDTVVLLIFFIDFQAHAGSKNGESHKAGTGVNTVL